jgi:uncharacterized membrane protein
MVNPFTPEAKKRIMRAIAEAEKKTSGEVRVHVKPYSSEEPIEEARKSFRRLGMQRTKERNGVLVFVAWKSRRFAIVGDDGIHRKVGDAFWSGTRDRMAALFSRGDLAGGIEAGVHDIGEKLKEHFPLGAGDKNELTDHVSEET